MNRSALSSDLKSDSEESWEKLADSGNEIEGGEEREEEKVVVQDVEKPKELSSQDKSKQQDMLNIMQIQQEISEAQNYDWAPPARQLADSILQALSTSRKKV